MSGSNMFIIFNISRANVKTISKYVSYLSKLCNHVDLPGNSLSPNPAFTNRSLVFWFVLWIYISKLLPRSSVFV